MIKINLASRKQSSIAGGGKTGGGGTDFLKGAWVDQAKELPIRKFLVPIIVGFVASYLLDGYKEDALAKITVAIAKQKVEEEKIQAELGKVKGYESQKKSLDADEVVIRTKVDTVQVLMGDRAWVPRMLVSTTSSLPKEVWLTGIKLDKDAVSIQGSSLGFNQVSDFMKNLDDGQFFSLVELVNSQQLKGNGDWVTFDLKAKRK